MSLRFFWSFQHLNTLQKTTILYNKIVYFPLKSVVLPINFLQNSFFLRNRLVTNSIIDPRPNFIQTVMINLISQLIDSIHISFLNLYFLNPFLDLLVQSLDLFQSGIV